MTLDNFEIEHEHKHAPKARSSEGSAPQAQPGLSAAGNKAFTALVQRSATKTQGAGPLDDEIASDIQSSRGGGQPLDETTKTDMEGQFGTDLSAVRIHSDSNADRLNRSVQAEAFTTGTDIYFSSGKYNPTSSGGRGLLAHELTHVMQQSSDPGRGAGEVSHPDDAHEREAKAVGDQVAASPVATPSASSGPASVDRSEAELDQAEGAVSVDREEVEEEEEMEA